MEGRPVSARGWSRRGPVLLVVVVLALLVGGPPAYAHVGGGPEASNYRVRVDDLNPPHPQVELRAGTGGQWIQLTNRGTRTVTVLGYDGEPFLRVSPDRVRVNTSSALLADNPDLVGGGPGGARRHDADPRWVKVTADNSVTWKDARVTGRSTDVSPGAPEPAGTRSDTRADTRAGTQTWRLPLRIDGADVTVTGSRTWVPAPASWPWYVLMACLAAATCVASWFRRWREVAVAVLCLAGLANVAHLVGAALDAQPGSGLAAWGGVVMTGAFCWPLVAVALVAALRHSEHAPFAIAVAGAVLVIFSGSDLGVFWHSQLPFAWPGAERFLVATALGCGGGLIAAGVRLIYRDSGTGPGDGGRMDDERRQLSAGEAGSW